MKLGDLSPELLEQAEKCETQEEFMALAKENGLELTEEDLEGIAGGVVTRWRGRKRKTVCPTAPTNQPAPTPANDASEQQ